jgi:hypothetical protein
MAEGKDSPEYKTMTTTTEKLELTFKHDLVSVGSALVACGLITTDQYGELRNTMYSEAQRTAKLIQWLQDAVLKDKQVYHTFVAVLGQNKLQYAHILGVLQETYARFQRGMIINLH